jgi:hypothetical protein
MVCGTSSALTCQDTWTLQAIGQLSFQSRQEIAYLAYHLRLRAAKCGIPFGIAQPQGNRFITRSLQAAPRGQVDVVLCRQVGKSLLFRGSISKFTNLFQLGEDLQRTQADIVVVDAV